MTILEKKKILLKKRAPAEEYEGRKAQVVKVEATEAPEKVTVLKMGE